MKQIDIFGNATEVITAPSGKTKTMQEMYGVIPNKQCKMCKHLYARQSRKRRWYKCELWDYYFRGISQASDIRLKNQACGKYSEQS